MKRSATYIGLMATTAIAVGLAACTGGDDGIPVATYDQVKKERDTAVAARDDAEKKLDAAKTERDELQGEVDREQANKDEAAEQAMRKTASAMYAGLEKAFDLRGQRIVASGFEVRVEDEDSNLLKPSGEIVASVGAWQGKAYIRKTTDGTVDHAIVYTNPGPAKTQLFTEKYTLTHGVLVADDLVAAEVAGSGFASGAGSKNHKIPAPKNTIMVRGTYNGAAGDYVCTGVQGGICTSTIGPDGVGIKLAGAGTWTFDPDSGAMASTPDADYQAFGWWLRKSSDGYKADHFNFNNVADDRKAKVTDLNGTATYSGPAAGQFATYSALGEGAASGAFTAAAKLTADFNADKISGMIDDFKIRTGLFS